MRGGGGAVLFFGGSGDPLRNYSIGGFQIALHTVEAMRNQWASELGAPTGRAATLEDVGAVAAFVASDTARTMIAATVNVSAGALIDR